MTSKNAYGSPPSTGKVVTYERVEPTTAWSRSGGREGYSQKRARAKETTA